MFHGIGMTVWAVKTEKELTGKYSDLHLSWSWGFAIIAVVFKLVALIPVIKSQRKGD